MEAVTTLIRKLRRADDAERTAIKAELVAMIRAVDGAQVREHIDNERRGEILEVQWELDEVLDATAPKKPDPPPQAPKPEPPKVEEPPKPKQLSAGDLNLVYDDPRGLMLYKTKVGERWFATQVDPRTGQPQTFELHPDEVKQIRTQLAGSPYWMLGAG